jgi:hypothetical protein
MEGIFASTGHMLREIAHHLPLAEANRSFLIRLCGSRNPRSWLSHAKRPGALITKQEPHWIEIKIVLTDVKSRPPIKRGSV